MDCKTARFLLDYARPNSHELDEAEACALSKNIWPAAPTATNKPRRTPGR